MTGIFTPLVKIVFFLVSLCMPHMRREYWKAFQQFFTKLTPEQKKTLKKAKREAKRAYQPRKIALGRGKYRLAELGELGGDRYQIYNTSMKDLSGFGLHICGYFMHLKGLVVLCLFMTLINLPAAMYFNGEEYGGASLSSLGRRYCLTQGSAICESVKGLYTDPVTNQTTVTYRNDHCPYKEKMGIMGMVAVCGLGLFIIVFRLTLDREMVAMDENAQTAQDYSVVVMDPDDDAQDLTEWYTYFSQFGEVAAITVAINNGKLLRLLAHQRYVRMMAQYEAPAGTDPFNELMENDEFQPSWLKHELNHISASRVLGFAGIGLPPDHWIREYKVTQTLLKEAFKQKFRVCQVFCSFETESAQRNCLKCLTAGLIPSLLDIQTVEPEYLFRGKNQLMVDEAPEPHDVIWENLGMTSPSEKFRQSLVCTSYLLVLNFGFATVVWYAFKNYSSFITSIVISLIDDYAPGLIRLTVDTTETHSRLSTRQWSIMSQMFFFLVVNSAVVIYVITPTTQTLSPDNIQQIAEIIVFNSFFSPVLRFLQLETRFRLRAQAPFACK
jgi:hypothetical protein